MNHSRHMPSHSDRQYHLLPPCTSFNSVQDGASRTLGYNGEHTVNDELKELVPSL